MSFNIVTWIIRKISLFFFSFQNPSKPHFNHYMFEAICLSIRITCKANPAAVVNFEEALFLVFTEILQNDVQGKLKGVVFFLIA